MNRKIFFDRIRPLFGGKFTQEQVVAIDAALDAYEGKEVLELSPRGAMAIISHEGIVQSKYRDAVGIWTIGVGHTSAAGPPDPGKVVGVLPLEEILQIFRNDIARYAADVRAAVKVPLLQHEFDALVSFHYNTGAIKTATLTKLLNQGKKDEAAKSMKRWRKPPEVGPRRDAEVRLFTSGVYPQPVATLYPASPSGSVLWSQGRRVDLTQLMEKEND